MTGWTEQSRVETLQELEQEERDFDVKTAQLRERKVEIRPPRQHVWAAAGRLPAP
jgi:hypothetical protein